MLQNRIFAFYFHKIQADTDQKITLKYKIHYYIFVPRKFPQNQQKFSTTKILDYMVLRCSQGIINYLISSRFLISHQSMHVQVVLNQCITVHVSPSHLYRERLNAQFSRMNQPPQHLGLTIYYYYVSRPVATGQVGQVST